MDIVILTALGVGGSTIFGAVIGLIFKRTNKEFGDLVMSLSAGIMLAAAFLGLIVPSLEYGGEAGVFITSIGMFAGAMLVNCFDYLLKIYNGSLGVGSKNKNISSDSLRRALTFASAIAIHNLPEGIAAGVGFGSDDTSQALIIAGAILLSILIIAIGMYIYNSSTNSIYSAADQISSQEQDSFNSQWTSYEEAQPGSSVKNMISKLISNAKTNAEEKTKLPDLYYVPNDPDQEDNNTVFLVGSDVAEPNISGFNSARSQIQTKHTYYVELHYSDVTSLVDAIYIHYYSPSQADYTLPQLGEEGEKTTYDNDVATAGVVESDYTAQVTTDND